MQSFLVLLTLFGLASAVPRPQRIDTEGVEASPDPVFITPAYAVLEQGGTTNEPDIASRSLIQKRDGNCAVQPAGSGPVSSPDTPDAFLANPAYPELANNAPTPDGYSIVLQNGGASLSASTYMGLRTLKSYDTLGCASLCDQASGCQAFNMYVERDPYQDPNAVDCPNPPSTTNYKCTLWGASVSAAEATNKGQWRDSFQVLIAGSNAYNKITPPPAVSCYTGPVELGGAINAPLNAQGQDTYMGYNYHAFSQSQGYDPSTCAVDCNSQTAYNKRHPAADGSYQTCVFFNAYVLSMNGIPQGLYCSKYSQVWAASYATNYGQYRGTDRYTVSRSYSYSLNMASDGTCGSGTSSQSSSVSQSSTSQSSVSQSTATSSAITTSGSTTTSASSSSQSSSESVTTSAVSPIVTSSSSSSEPTKDASSSTLTVTSSSTSDISTTSPSSSSSSSSSPTSTSSSSSIATSSTSSSSSVATPTSSSSASSSSSSVATSTSSSSTSSISPSNTATSTTSSVSSTTSSTSTRTSSVSSTTSSTSTRASSTSSSTSSTASSAPTSFCLQDPSTGQYASLQKGGNGLQFMTTTFKETPSLFTISSSSILTSVKTSLIAAINLSTFGKDGTTEGHIEGTTLEQAATNQNYKPFECEIRGEALYCRSAANYIDPVKTPAKRSQVYVTTKGNDGVDQYLFAPTTVAGAVAIKVLPGSACGPNYS